MLFLDDSFSTFNTNDDDLPWDFGTVRVPGLSSAASTVRRVPGAQATVRGPVCLRETGCIECAAERRFYGVANNFLLVIVAIWRYYGQHSQPR